MKYEINYHSYNFELIEYVNGFFEGSVVDATFIIHLEGNGRYESIKNQLEMYKPSKKVFILHNKGYKKSQKQEYINNTAKDLVDAYITIFKYSQNNNFKNIFILEDDFIFDEKVLDNKNTNIINGFIHSKENEPFIYYIGCLPYVIKNHNHNHYEVLISTGSHSVIYSNKFIMNLLNNFDQRDLKDWDIFINTIYYHNIYKRYMYKECLCYQPFPETENFKNWGKDVLPNLHVLPILYDNNNICIDILSTFFQNIIREVLKFTKLDTDPKNGFELFYNKCIKLPF